MDQNKLDEKPSLVLGTAMWGWTVAEKEVFQLLDHYYNRGYRSVDAATNYPINKNPSDFRASELLLKAWIDANGVKDLSINMKVGSLSNLKIPDHNLKPSFLQFNWQYYQKMFGANLKQYMLHWDNREDVAAIRDSLLTLKKIEQEGTIIGLSGLKFPELHAQVLEELEMEVEIQLKHNLLYSDLARYRAVGFNHGFFLYGINAGGLKTEINSYQENSSLKVRGGAIKKLHPIIQDMQLLLDQFKMDTETTGAAALNRLSMIFALGNPGVKGVLIGPSKLPQLKSSLDFYESTVIENISSTYSSLLSIHRKYAPTEGKI